MIAKEARALGLCQGFAPMLGLARDPRWGRVEESYGEDPWLVSRMAVAYINGLQGRGPRASAPTISSPRQNILSPMGSRGPGPMAKTMMCPSACCAKFTCPRSRPP